MVMAGESAWREIIGCLPRREAAKLASPLNAYVVWEMNQRLLTKRIAEHVVTPARIVGMAIDTCIDAAFDAMPGAAAAETAAGVAQ
jgi:hypothetical protein